MTTARLELDRDIQPVSEFRKNAAQFIERIQKEKRPIVLTQHGKSAAVLVDVAEYQRMVDKLDKMEDLLKSEHQIARKEVYSHEEAKQMIQEKIEKWK